MKGRIHIYTGTGKGKTTAALGLLLRFCGHKGKACLIQFDKPPQKGGEWSSLKKLGIERHAAGLKRWQPGKTTFRFGNTIKDKVAALAGLHLAKKKMAAGIGLLVLDEILSATRTGLLEKRQVEELLAEYETLGRPCELVLTGHQIWKELVCQCDLVSEIKKVKHYFDSKNKKARKGIEY